MSTYKLTGTVTAVALIGGDTRATIAVKDGENDASYFYLFTDQLRLKQKVEVMVTTVTVEETA